MKELARLLRIYRHAFTLELANLMAYRLDFWVRALVAVVIETLIAFYLWSAIFAARGEALIGGLSFPQMMVYYFCASLSNMTLRGAEISFIASAIYNGSLTRFMVYPFSFLVSKGFSYLAHSALYALQIVIGIAALAICFNLPAGINFSISNTVAGIFVLLLAAVLYYLMIACLEMASFWAENVWSLSVMLGFCVQFLGGFMIPLSLYPEWARILLFKLPFPYMLWVPIRGLMGQLSINEWLVCVGMLSIWIVLFGFLANFIWSRGIRNYTAVGL